MSAAEIAAANHLFEDAVRRGDAAALAKLYTTDAWALPPDGTIARGRDAIQSFWASAFGGLGLKDIHLGTIEVDVTGDMAVEVGQADLTLAPATDDPAKVSVKYVVVWKRIGGQWRLHRDIWNAGAA